MIRVAYLDHTARMSGGEIALLHLLKHLDTSAIHPLVLLAEEGPLAARLRDLDFDVRIVPLNEQIRNRSRDDLHVYQFASVVQTFRYARVIARILRQENITLIHANSLKSDIYGAIAARIANIPIIWHIHDMIVAPYLKPVVAGSFRTVARYVPDGVIANSNASLTALRLPKAKPQIVIYPGFDGPLTPIAAIWEKASIRKDEFIVLHVGRLTEWKGQHILLAAAKHFLSDSSVQFRIAGDALFGEEDYKRRLIRQIEDERMSHVRLLGHTDRVREWMLEADLLVHSSILPEPFGQVIVEGMAAGLPVIASDAGGPREIVFHRKTGLLVTPGKPELLAEAIQWMLDHPHERVCMGIIGRSRVENDFIIQQHVRLIPPFYRKVLNQKSCRSS